jgi:hypothetical protein
MDTERLQPLADHPSFCATLSAKSTTTLACFQVASSCDLTVDHHGAGAVGHRGQNLARERYLGGREHMVGDRRYARRAARPRGGSLGGDRPHGGSQGGRARVRGEAGAGVSGKVRGAIALKQNRRLPRRNPPRSESEHRPVSPCARSRRSAASSVRRVWREIA